MTDESMMQVDEGGGRQSSVPVSLPPNSRKYRAAQSGESPKREKKEKIITGVAVQRKKGVWSRALESIVAETGGSITDYLILDVLIPAAKETISDMFSKGLERLFYGDTRRARQTASGGIGFTNYAGIRRTQTQPGVISQRARATHDFQDVIIPRREDAMDVLDSLRIQIDQYGQVAVSDFYDLVGITSEFVDENWGWYDLRAAGVRPVRGGYMVILPRTQPLET